MLLLAENLRKGVVCIQLHTQLCENKHFSWQKIVISKIKMQFSVYFFFCVCVSITLAVLAIFSLWGSYWSLCFNYYFWLEFKINTYVNPIQTKVCIKDDLCARKTYLDGDSLHFLFFLWCIGAVLLSSVQGLAINVDPVLYTWLIYQPQKRASRHIQQVRIFGGKGVGRRETFSSISASSAF